ncbi:hypothetical protein R3P38DRAFT_3217182 [Favolaschia claudopus]|uniref:Uncharacterized protein n=1 Tax=Favolaschia claudopus TaxID=2862362 RepID=A0AAW0A723_9AGAR
MSSLEPPDVRPTLFLVQAIETEAGGRILIPPSSPMGSESASQHLENPKPSSKDKLLHDASPAAEQDADDLLATEPTTPSVKRQRSSRKSTGGSTVSGTIRRPRRSKREETPEPQIPKAANVRDYHHPTRDKPNEKARGGWAEGAKAAKQNQALAERLLPGVSVDYAPFVLGFGLARVPSFKGSLRRGTANYPNGERFSTLEYLNPNAEGNSCERQPSGDVETRDPWEPTIKILIETADQINGAAGTRLGSEKCKDQLAELRTRNRAASDRIEADCKWLAVVISSRILVDEEKGPSCLLQVSMNNKASPLPNTPIELLRNLCIDDPVTTIARHYPDVLDVFAQLHRLKPFNYSNIHPKDLVTAKKTTWGGKLIRLMRRLDFLASNIKLPDARDEAELRVLHALRIRDALQRGGSARDLSRMRVFRVRGVGERVRKASEKKMPFFGLSSSTEWSKDFALYYDALVNTVKGYVVKMMGDASVGGTRRKIIDMLMGKLEVVVRDDFLNTSPFSPDWTGVPLICPSFARYLLRNLNNAAPLYNLLTQMFYPGAVDILKRRNSPTQKVPSLTESLFHHLGYSMFRQGKSPPDFDWATSTPEDVAEMEFMPGSAKRPEVRDYSWRYGDRTTRVCLGLICLVFNHSPQLLPAIPKIASTLATKIPKDEILDRNMLAKFVTLCEGWSDAIVKASAAGTLVGDISCDDFRNIPTRRLRIPHSTGLQETEIRLPIAKRFINSLYAQAHTLIGFEDRLYIDYPATVALRDACLEWIQKHTGYKKFPAFSPSPLSTLSCPLPPTGEANDASVASAQAAIRCAQLDEAFIRPLKTLASKWSKPGVLGVPRIAEDAAHIPEAPHRGHGRGRLTELFGFAIPWSSEEEAAAYLADADDDGDAETPKAIDRGRDSESSSDDEEDDDEGANADPASGHSAGSESPSDDEEAGANADPAMQQHEVPASTASPANSAPRNEDTAMEDVVVSTRSSSPIEEFPNSDAAGEGPDPLSSPSPNARKRKRTSDSNDNTEDEADEDHPPLKRARSSG